MSFKTLIIGGVSVVALVVAGILYFTALDDTTMQAQETNNGAQEPQTSDLAVYTEDDRTNDNAANPETPQVQYNETNNTSPPDEERSTNEGILRDQATSITEMETQAENNTQSNTTQTMLVAGGCFWCVEADLEKLPGVIGAVSGYAGGTLENPTYETYAKGGHREVVEVTYDPSVVSFEEILIYAMKHMDPTDDDGSFKDRGDYYSPAFYYESSEEREIIDSLILEVDENGPYDKPLAIDVEERPKFWPAEDYHQDYYKKTFSSLKYKYYRNASGRNDFIQKYWGIDVGPTLSWRERAGIDSTGFWSTFSKPPKDELRDLISEMQYKVTQEDGTEPPYNNRYDKHFEEGIYVDILSGEPLFSSTDKYDSGTGWPSFVKPIIPSAVTEHEDRKLFSVRTEIRSAIADNHLGHVFTDGPKDRGGLRYCMNSAALSFVPKSEMRQRGYGSYLALFE